MSLKKKNRLAPVMMDEIVSGQTYIRMGVSLGGSMWIEYLTFYGRPSKRDSARTKPSWAIKVRTSREFDYFDDGVRSVNDMGMVPNDIYNHHRVFRYNLKNDLILQKMVWCQMLAEYLTLIGIADVESEVSEMGEEQSLMGELDDDIDIDDGFDDFEEDDAFDRDAEEDDELPY